MCVSVCLCVCLFFFANTPFLVAKVCAGLSSLSTVLLNKSGRPFACCSEQAKRNKIKLWRGASPKARLGHGEPCSIHNSAGSQEGFVFRKEPYTGLAEPLHRWRIPRMGAQLITQQYSLSS